MPLLKVLASPTRLRLLSALREPAHAAEVRIPAAAARGELQEGRTLSRPAIIQNIQVLEDVGLVEAVPREDGSDLYVTNHQVLFRALDEISQLAAITPTVDVDVGDTLERPEGGGRKLPEGAKLVLVTGPRQGVAFELEGQGPWLVGRGEEAEIQLEYDPYVSREHVEIRREEDGAFVVEALEETINDPLVNFQPLLPGRQRLLLAGSILSVGASALVFQLA